ncbi:MAG: SPFH domain-containing protein [Deltaproteobacteria bacterium]|nr:SPFH domain-containing protein [Deltaproteobacteria bacterium]
MLGFKLVKADPNMYFMQYRAGKVIKSGTGLSFVYFAPTSSIVAIPLSSENIPFIFNEVTADFQEVTVQGQVTYRIANPNLIAKMINFTLASNNRDYVCNDSKTLHLRVLNQVQMIMRSQLQIKKIRSALTESDILAGTIKDKLDDSEVLRQFGIEVLSVSVLSVKPKPETSRALEAEVRERILLEADEAVYQRRNAAVEQERTIKENELNTEIAVENKKRQIRETKIDADFAIQEKRQIMEQKEMNGNVLLEEKRKDLVKIAAENKKEEADAHAYGMTAAMEAFKNVESKTIQALASVGMDPGQLIAIAFQNIGENADKIGNLNIAPELLQELMSSQQNKR